MRSLAVLLALAAVLAGCAGKAGDPADEPAADAPDDVPDDVRPFAGNLSSQALRPLSATLHLLDRPTLTTAAPGPGEPVRVRAWSSTDYTQAAIVGLPEPPQDWTVEWPSRTSGLVGNASLWVDVQGPAFNDPRAPCFWSVVIGYTVESPQGFASQTGSVCAGNEPAQVPEGPRLLTFPFGFPDMDVPEGATVFLQVFGGLAPQPPGTEVVVLAGSAEFDSQATFQGVLFPVE